MKFHSVHAYQAVLSCLTVFFALMVASPVADAARALGRLVTLRQPDGTTFKAKTVGDEWGKMLITEDGCALVQDAQGYYCYAMYDLGGHRYSSGVRLGAVPTTALARQARAASQNIPYSTISAQASARRAAARASEQAERIHRGIVILAEFTDLRFTYTRDDFDQMLNSEGYNFNGATGSARDYFKSQFPQEDDFVFDVAPIVQVSKGIANYGGNSSVGIDQDPGGIVYEACRLASAQGINFADYDEDGDGDVDIICIVVAGGDEAQDGVENHIWSHEWDLESAGYSLTINGKTIYKYAMSCELKGGYGEYPYELSSIGTFCHEFSHALGLVDLYDTDYSNSNGTSDALWFNTSLMDGGNYNNDGCTPPNYCAVEMDVLGIGECRTLELGETVMPPIGSEQVYWRINGDKDKEYFLIEARQATGWDQYIGGNGLLAYHVDKSNNQAGMSTAYGRTLTAAQRWNLNQVNCYPSHQCADLIEAMPKAKNVSQVFFPYSTYNSLGTATHSAFCFWDKSPVMMSINNISRDKSTGEVTISVEGPLSYSGTDAFQDAAIVSWETTSSAYDNAECHLSWFTANGDTTTVSVEPYESCKYAYTIEGLSPKTAYKVNVSLGSGEDQLFVTASFSTKAYYNDCYPFIYMNSATRNADGSFAQGSRIPLRVYNAKGVEEVKWYFNKAEIKPGGDGYHTLKSGTLEAILYYADGSRDKIRKVVTVK